MKLSNDELDYQKRILELIDPVVWLKAYTDFRPWPYEAELLRGSHLRTRVVRKSRQIGITTTIAHEAVWKAFTTNNRVILIVSPSQRQSGMVMSIIREIVNANTRLSALVARNSDTELHLKNGSMIVATPNNPDRIRGYAANDIYLDEAAHFMNDEPVMAAIRPMLIATKGTFTVVSTPFGKRGLFWDLYRMAVNQQNLKSDVKAYDLYPSSISPVADLERARLDLNDIEFRQECLGEFIEQVDTYYPMDLIQPCVDPALEQLDQGEIGHRYFMGIDLAKQRDETVVILLDKTEDEIFRVRHIEAWSHMDYSEQIGRIGLLAGRFKITRAAVDRTGVGEAVFEDLKRAVPGIEGVVFSVNTKIDLVSRLRALLEKRQIIIPNNRKLIMQINSLSYQLSKTGNLLFATTDKEHDDYLWALALA